MADFPTVWAFSWLDLEMTLAKESRGSILPNEREIAPSGSFAIVVCLTGALECAGLQFKPGDFFLVPAQMEDRMLRPAGENTSLLRVTIPRS